MKQILQSLKTGKTSLVNVPCPSPRPGNLLVRTSASVVSAGTERMLVEFGKASLLSKARQQPDKFRQVLDKIKTDGLLPTLDSVLAKLDQPIPLGYSNAGVVLAVGEGVDSFAVGDRVASNGHHAEMVCVPENLCARIPDNVSDEAAAFTVIGSIALQGIRLAGPTLGEAFVVTGLGLVGLIAAQLLKAHGCRVLGIDLDPDRLAIARGFGVETVDLSLGEDPVAAGLAFSRGRGVDGVIITADTRSSEPVSHAARMCRKRGRIVLVGVTGLELSRADFYEKELSFQVSCSYGPGRYDPAYEEGGRDYPLAYVRWTEQRNFEAVLDMLATGGLDVNPLILHRFQFERSEEAYRLLAGGGKTLGIVLQYPQLEDRDEGDLLSGTILLCSPDIRHETQKLGGATTGVAVVGAGNFTAQVILPALKNSGVRLKVIASSGGVSGVHSGKKFGFEETTTDTGRVFSDPDVDAVFVTTRHDSHARFVIAGLRAGKHVFVEKPLCLTGGELEDIVEIFNEHPGKVLMVGFNRRFSPHVQKMKHLLSGVSEPKSFIITVNAGAIPACHWTQDVTVGGGRIIGEVCHFIDLLRYLAGQPVKEIKATKMGGQGSLITEDKIAITLSFSDGSLGTIHYLANGSKSFPKERVEVFCGGRILALDNFRVLRGYGWSGFAKMKTWRQDKGHAAGVRAFLEAVKKGGPGPIPFDQIVEVTRVTLEVDGIVRK